MQEENLSTERESSCDITRRLVNRKRIVDWRHWQQAGAVVGVEGLELAPSRLLEEVGQGVATILYIPIHRCSDDGCLLTVKTTPRFISSSTDSSMLKAQSGRLGFVD